MSLLSMDRDAYVVGESLMPTPDKNDLIIAVSGSGESDYTIKTVRILPIVSVSDTISISIESYSVITRIRFCQIYRLVIEIDINCVRVTNNSTNMIPGI